MIFPAGASQECHTCTGVSAQVYYAKQPSMTLASHQNDAERRSCLFPSQVYYEDLDNGDRMEAYCNLVHCYSLPHDQGLWVEHGYFDDRYACTCCPVHGRYDDTTSGSWQCNIVIYGEADATAWRQQNMRPCACLPATVVDILAHCCFTTCNLLTILTLARHSGTMKTIWTSYFRVGRTCKACQWDACYYNTLLFKSMSLLLVLACGTAGDRS